MNRAFHALALPLALTLVGIAGAAPAAAWGPIGHRVGAEIAARNIDGRTRAHVAEILGGESLADAVNVPDEERSNPDPFWQEAGPWHYVTLPEGLTAGQLEHPPEGDAVIALEGFTAALRDPSASREDKARALRFALHIVTDLHMPLHVGREGDRGGNDFFVTWWDGPANLHFVWDEGMIVRKQLSAAEYTERLEARMTADEVIAWWDPAPTTWIQESADLRDRIYPRTGRELGEGTRDSPARIEFWDYLWEWTPDMERRLMQSGIRLAAYLDWVFAEPG